MHEFSLLSGILNKIVSEATKAGADQVVQVHVWIGAQAHISGPHFREHFEHAVKGTMIEGATLEIEVSADQNDPQASEIVLRSFEVELDSEELH